MAYTTPHTATTGNLITASGHNTSIRDNLEYLKGRAGTIAFEAGASFVGDITLTGTSRTIHWPNDQSVKENYDGMAYVRGTGVGYIYDMAPSAIKLLQYPGFVERIVFDLNASPSITVGGSTVLTTAAGKAVDSELLDGLNGTSFARSSMDTFVGDGGTGGRHISVGFIPTIVHLWNQSTGNSMYISTHDSGSLRLVSTGNPAFSTAVKKHPTDGFIVGSGSNQGNNSGETYRWVAQ
jgi:hypothetical protein